MFWRTGAILCAHTVSYAAPLWAMLHPSGVFCALIARLYLTELGCTLLCNASPYWAALHPSELLCTLWPTLHLLSNAAPYWAFLRPSKLCFSLPTDLSFILLSYLAPSELGFSPYLALLYNSKLSFILLSYPAPSKLGCTLLSYAAPYWATLHPSELEVHPLSYAAPYYAILCGSY